MTKNQTFISSLIICLSLSTLCHAQYVLNGKGTDNCPFYTVLVGNNCEDSYIKSLDNPILLSEALFKNTFDLTDFELSGWKKGNTDAANKYITECAGKSIYGGYQALSGNNIVRYVSQEFTQIPNHFQLSIKLQFYYIDSWDKEWMTIYLDNVAVYSYRFNDNGVARTPMCGRTESGWNEFVQNISVVVPHTASKATVKVQWEVDQNSNDESGGFREIQVVAVGNPTYQLNGKTTDNCPFYTQLDSATKTCVDNYVASLQAPVIVSELFYNRYFTDTGDLEKQGWTRGNVQGDGVYAAVCYDRSYYGGYDALTNGDRTKSLSGQFNNLPAHSQIMIKFNFLFIDSWDNEFLRVFVDDVQVFEQKHQHNLAGVTPVCGSTSWRDLQKNFEILVDHIGSSAKVRIEWTLDQGVKDESGAIREIQVVVVGNPLYKLNGQDVDTCPFFTTANLDEMLCVDEFFSKQRDSHILSQSLMNKAFNIDFLDASDWKRANNDSGKKFTTVCDGKTIYGGQDAFTNEEKTTEKVLTARFTNIPEHEFLSIRFNFYFLDSWDNEVLTVLVDGVEVKRQVQSHQNALNSAICGSSSWKDLISNQDIQVEHTNPNAEIVIKWKVDQHPNDESGGLRELQVFSYKTQLYNLNGKTVTKCPFYAPLDEETLTCKDEYVSTLDKPIFINEALTNKKFQAGDLASSGWQVSPVEQGDSQLSTCDGVTLLGGYNSFPQNPTQTKTLTGVFSNIPRHSQIVLKFLFYFIDSWDDEYLRVFVDGQQVTEFKHNFQNDGTSVICGATNFQDLVKEFVLEVPHKSKNLNVSITWTLNQGSSDESGGVREIQIIGSGAIELPTCVTLFTECDFEGESQSLCENTPSLDNSVIKSIYLPEDVASVKLYEDVEYGGRSLVYTESQTCLEGIDYKFFAQVQKVKLLNKKQLQKIHHLKRNQKASD